MPPRRRSAPPPLDIDAVRSKVAAGKIVRVGVARSAQFPEGSTGRVRRVGDPTVDGEEFVQVELSLNGTKDVLPFTPADLTAATRARAGAAQPANSTAAPAERRVSPGPRSMNSPAPPAASAPAVLPGSPLPGSPLPGSPLPGSPPTARARAARSGRRPPAVTITIGTSEREPTQWRIEAKAGTKVLIRAAAVPSARVWELVRALDDEGLTRAVGNVLDEQRQAAQARADTLTAELEQVRAELKALPGNGS